MGMTIDDVYWSNKFKRLQADYDARLKADLVVVLDKIRAEIIARDRNVKIVRSDGCCFFTAEEVLQILDKYKAESEET